MCSSQEEEGPETQAFKGPGAGIGRIAAGGDQRVIWERAGEGSGPGLASSAVLTFHFTPAEENKVPRPALPHPSAGRGLEIHPVQWFLSLCGLPGLGQNFQVSFSFPASCFHLCCIVLRQQRQSWGPGREREVSIIHINSKASMGAGEMAQEDPGM